MNFRDVELELVRPGPPHNQLLSPLTQYIALCGESSPVTFRVDFEHQRLLSRLDRLRYRERHSARQRELTELGEDIGALFADMSSLGVEIANARRGPDDSDESEIVHLRLVLSGSELALLPFEVAIAPQAMPGEGIGMLLQGRVPIVPTREIRRSRPLTSSLNAIREVKVLFAYAAPDGLSPIPAHEHLAELRAALGPWIGPEEPMALGDDGAMVEADRDDNRVAQVKRHLRVLPDATLEDIYRACAQEHFTHVHILAHGDVYDDAGEQRFGVALMAPGGSGGADVVSGQRLANALGAESADGNLRSGPFWVTLATCDAGNQSSVLVPGGSIAHELHVHGVPWVVASQFPLSKVGSIQIARFLYPRLFRGDDPRQVLYELRRFLYSQQTAYHDWASLVVYASMEPDFDQHVNQFYEQATIFAVERLMKVADKWSGLWHQAIPSPDPSPAYQHMKKVLLDVDPLFDRWNARLPQGADMYDRRARTNFYGMQGSVQKRLALLKSTDLYGDGDAEIEQQARSHFARSRSAYRRALDEWAIEDGKFNWTASQYLALSAVMEGFEYDDAIATTCQAVARRDLRSPDPGIQAWAYATLAELELLRLAHHGATAQPAPADLFEEVQGNVAAHCRKIIELTGPDSFHTESTRRQFQRYLDGWGRTADVEVTGRMQTVAAEAVQVLGGS